MGQFSMTISAVAGSVLGDNQQPLEANWARRPKVFLISLMQLS